MKTAELTGVPLDYWTARADGRTAKILKPGDKINSMRVKEEMCAVLTPGYDDWWQPFHVYWGNCGEIIDRERMNFATIGTGRPDENGNAPIVAIPQEGRRAMAGPTHLIAAMRAFIASKFGDEVPDEVPACY